MVCAGRRRTEGRPKSPPARSTCTPTGRCRWCSEWGGPQLYITAAAAAGGGGGGVIIIIEWIRRGALGNKWPDKLGHLTLAVQESRSVLSGV